MDWWFFLGDASESFVEIPCVARWRINQEIETQGPPLSRWPSNLNIEKKREGRKVQNSKIRKVKISICFYLLNVWLARKVSLERWQIAWGFWGVGAQAVSTQMFLLLFCCCSLVGFLCSANLQLLRQDYIASTMLWIPLIGKGFVGFERVDTRNPKMIGLHHSPLRDPTMLIKHMFRAVGWTFWCNNLRSQQAEITWYWDFFKVSCHISLKKNYRYMSRPAWTRPKWDYCDSPMGLLWEVFRSWVWHDPVPFFHGWSPFQRCTKRTRSRRWAKASHGFVGGAHLQWTSSPRSITPWTILNQTSA